MADVQEAKKDDGFPHMEIDGGAAPVDADRARELAARRRLDPRGGAGAAAEAPARRSAAAPAEAPARRRPHPRPASAGSSERPTTTKTLR